MNSGKKFMLALLVVGGGLIPASGNASQVNKTQTPVMLKLLDYDYPKTAIPRLIGPKHPDGVAILFLSMDGKYALISKSSYTYIEYLGVIDLETGQEVSSVKTLNRFGELGRTVIRHRKTGEVIEEWNRPFFPVPYKSDENYEVTSEYWGPILGWEARLTNQKSGKFSTDGNFAVWTNGSSVAILNVKKQSLYNKIYRDGYSVASVDFMKDMKHVVVLQVSDDGKQETEIVFSADSGQVVKNSHRSRKSGSTRPSEEHPLVSRARERWQCSSDLNYCWAKENRNTIRVADSRVIGDRHLIIKHPEEIENVLYESDSKSLVTSSRDGLTRIYDLPSQSLLMEWVTAETCAETSSCSIPFHRKTPIVSPNLRYILMFVNKSSPVVKVYDLKRRAVLGVQMPISSWDQLPQFSNDSRYIAYTEAHRDIIIDDLESDRNKSIVRHEKSLRDFRWAPNNRFILTIDSDWQLRRFEIPN